MYLRKGQVMPIYALSVTLVATLLVPLALSFVVVVVLRPPLVYAVIAALWAAGILTHIGFAAYAATTYQWRVDATTGIYLVMVFVLVFAMIGVLALGEYIEARRAKNNPQQPDNIRKFIRRIS